MYSKYCSNVLFAVASSQTKSRIHAFHMSRSQVIQRGATPRRGDEKHRPWQQNAQGSLILLSHPRLRRVSWTPSKMRERCEDVRSAAAALRCAPRGLLSLPPPIFLGLFSHPPRAAAIIGFHREGLQEKTCYWIYSVQCCLFRRR